MKKVLFFIESLAGGGAEKVLTTLVKHLDKSKYDITVLTVVNTGVYVDEVKAYCKLQYMLPDSESLSGIFEKIKYYFNYKRIYNQPLDSIYRKYVREKYDIEVAFVEGFATKFIAASNNPTSKKVCWVHIDMEQNPYADAYYNSLEEERNTYKSFDQIIGVSQTVKKTFEHKFSLPGSVNVIYNPVDYDDISVKSQGLQQVEWGEGLKLISVGRLEQQKGYDRLISVLAKLKKQDFKYQLCILGEGSEREKLEELIKNNKLEEKVHLLGFKTNPYKWMKSADAFVCSSRAEGYSLVIAEAMLLGIPVFSVDCAGPNELLDYGKYGLLVNNTDTDLEIMLTNLLSGKYDLDQYKKLAEQRRSFFELRAVLSEVERIL